MNYFALFYEVVEDYLSRRTPFREEHLAYARQAEARGELILAGAFDPPAGVLLIFRGLDEAVAVEFARGDPYVTNGLVTDWNVRKWSVVVGERIRQ